MKHLLFASVALGTAFFSVADAADLSVALSEIEDRRTSGQFFGGLNVKLDLRGYDLERAKGIKPVVLEHAVDDRGRDLMKETEGNRQAYFHFEPNRERRDRMQISLDLKNPRREARTVRLDGKVEVYFPERDPSATVELPGFLGRTGKALPELSKRGVTLTCLTGPEYSALMERQKRGESIEGALGELVSAMFGNFFGANSENSLVFLIDDPNRALVHFEVLDAQGKEIQPRGRSAGGKYYALEFAQRPGNDAKLVVYLATAKSVEAVAFRLDGVELP